MSTHKTDGLNELEDMIEQTTEKALPKMEDNGNILVKEIIQIQERLQKIDEYFTSLPSLQSKIDEEISDLLHYIENNNLSPRESVKMIHILKDKRMERRNLCNDYEIKRVYYENRNKMSVDTQRQFFLSAICKKAKELNTEYRNRRYTNEEINNMLKGIRVKGEKKNEKN